MPEKQIKVPKKGTFLLVYTVKKDSVTIYRDVITKPSPEGAMCTNTNWYNGNNNKKTGEYDYTKSLNTT